MDSISLGVDEFDSGMLQEYLRLIWHDLRAHGVLGYERHRFTIRAITDVLQDSNDPEIVTLRNKIDFQVKVLHLEWEAFKNSVPADP